MEIPPLMAQYPVRSDYSSFDEWLDAVGEYRTEIEKQRDLIQDHNTGMTGYYADTMTTILSANKGENRVFSPLSLYLAMGMLAETTAGESRQQILDLLRVEDTVALQEKCFGLWNGVYTDSDSSFCRLSNSLWLRNDDWVAYRPATLDRLAQQYYATVYRGEMGSEEYNTTLQNWINDHTGGLLKNQSGGLELDPATALALVNTIYLDMKWSSAFSPKSSFEGSFYADSGEVTCTFMKKESYNTIGYGDRFTAVSLSLKENYFKMNVFLPHEGVEVASLLQDAQVLGYLEKSENAPETEQDRRTLLKLPKFDIDSDLDLIEQLKRLGVSNVFSEQAADFSSLVERQNFPVYVSNIKQATRVKVDESGCVAASYTYVAGIGSSPVEPPEPLEITVDRPFMFAITGPGNTILFAGIVENP